LRRSRLTRLSVVSTKAPRTPRIPATASGIDWRVKRRENQPEHARNFKLGSAENRQRVVFSRDDNGPCFLTPAVTTVACASEWPACFPLLDMVHARYILGLHGRRSLAPMGKVPRPRSKVVLMLAFENFHAGKQNCSSK
jgi:hypothetical protein